MTISTAPLRLLTAALAGAMTLSLLAACTPEPEPKPTKTALFASEEEAFAAAEETYREYTEALNTLDTSDPKTFDRVFEFTTGDFEDRDRENLSTMNAEGYKMLGETTVQRFAGLSVDPGSDTVVGLVCVDVSKTDIQDEEGRSVVPSDRPEFVEAQVTFVAEGGRLLISRADRAEQDICDE